MLRDTVTYDIQAVYPMGQLRPATGYTAPTVTSPISPEGAIK